MALVAASYDHLRVPPPLHDDAHQMAEGREPQVTADAQLLLIKSFKRADPERFDRRVGRAVGLDDHLTPLADMGFQGQQHPEGPLRGPKIGKLKPRIR